MVHPSLPKAAIETYIKVTSFARKEKKKRKTSDCNPAAKENAQVEVASLDAE